MAARITFNGYDCGQFFDELFLPDGRPRQEALPLIERINQLPPGEFARRHEAAERALLRMGITFTVYGDESGTERIFPFDLVPRIVSGREWDHLNLGLKQRMRALNAFIDDVYHGQRIVQDGVMPAHVLTSSQGYRPQCVGLDPPQGVWCHIAGIDLVRDGNGVVHVLEDNLRCPSGVSYVIENREVMKQTFPTVFEGQTVRPVADYPGHLLRMLEEVAPEDMSRPSVAVLTPGSGNAAYFEHSYLAQQMGVELV